MFCSSCGTSMVNNANYCQQCGIRVTRMNNETREPSGASTATNVKEDESCGNFAGRRASTATASLNCSTATSSVPTFAQFRARKEDDRSSHFKKKNGKRVKVDKKICDVKVNIGIMIKKEDKLVVKRGATLPVTVPESIAADDLLEKAVEKHTRFNKDVITSEDKTLYYLLFGDKTRVENLPGSNEPFVLKKYTEEIDKAYSRITLYLCLRSDYMHIMWSDFDLDISDNEECVPHHDSSKSLITSYTLPVSAAQDHASQTELKTVPCISLDEPDVINEPVSVAKKSQCPICFKRFPVQSIEDHAANCSLWLEECDQLPELYDNEEMVTVDDGSVADCNIGHSSHKAVLQEQIKECAKALSADRKRVTVRRKFLWDDFKAALKKKRSNHFLI